VRHATPVATGEEIPTGLVKRGDLDMKVYVTGELRASHSEMLTAPAIGGGALQITRLLHTGTTVTEGDMVMDFDPSEQHYKLDQNRSELLQSEQEITKARAEVMHSHLLNQCHDFLPRARADREHRYHGCDSKDHPEHSQQRAQAMQQQILES
jgi:multidrug resistance efflux pump